MASSLPSPRDAPFFSAQRCPSGGLCWVLSCTSRCHGQEWAETPPSRRSQGHRGEQTRGVGASEQSSTGCRPLKVLKSVSLDIFTTFSKSQLGEGWVCLLAPFTGCPRVVRTSLETDLLRQPVKMKPPVPQSPQAPQSELCQGRFWALREGARRLPSALPSTQSERDREGGGRGEPGGRAAPCPLVGPWASPHLRSRRGRPAPGLRGTAPGQVPPAGLGSAACGTGGRRGQGAVGGPWGQVLGS